MPVRIVVIASEGSSIALLSFILQGATRSKK